MPLTMRKKKGNVAMQVRAQGLWCIQSSIILHRPTLVFCVATHVIGTNICNAQKLWETSIGRRQPMHSYEIWLHH